MPLAISTIQQIVLASMPSEQTIAAGLINFIRDGYLNGGEGEETSCITLLNIKHQQMTVGRRSKDYHFMNISTGTNNFQESSEMKSDKFPHHEYLVQRLFAGVCQL